MIKLSVKRINCIQKNFFSKLTHLFGHPLPHGVQERLEKIVASAHIKKGDIILDVGSGTGILISIIKKYDPQKIYACDLSDAMLEKLQNKYPLAITIMSDVSDLRLENSSINVVFVNACYSNLADKKKALINISRMTKTGGHLIISHPMGKSFIDMLKTKSPFPLDDFPSHEEAIKTLKSFGFKITKFIDENKLYLLVAKKIT